MISTLDESGWKKDWSQTLKLISVENLSVGQWFLSEEKSVYKERKNIAFFMILLKPTLKKKNMAQILKKIESSFSFTQWKLRISTFLSI